MSDRVVMRVDTDHGADQLTIVNEVRVTRLAPCLHAIGKAPQVFVSSPVLPEGRAVCIDVELESLHQTIFQMFYGRHGAKAFAQARSATRRVPAGHNRFRLLFTDDQMNGHYRIDFSTGWADLHLKRLEFKIIEPSGRTV